MKLTRRSFLKASAAGFGAAVLSYGLTGCGSSSGSGSNKVDVSFDYGVASGDPLHNAVVIWTRVSPKLAAANSVQVRWEVALDNTFKDMVHDGMVQVGSDTDFTLKVDLQNLEAGTRYYYRFASNERLSPVGTTRTLPEGELDQVKLAVMSCSNYPAGYFHAYAEVAKRDDLDAVLHLGDYIYEYGAGGYASDDAQALGRSFPADNNSELLTLSDYRKRYALYRSDKDLQALHQAAPFITVWDDHEVSNDTWRDGAQNHNEGEGHFDDRKLAALKAYFEWMPIRGQDSSQPIYRKFEFGDLVSLYMLDTRVLARDKQLSYADFDLTSQAGQGAFMVALADANRSLLGGQQLNWLTDNMALSAATWQVLGQQVLMTKMWLPAEIMLILASVEATLTAGGDVSAILTQANLVFAELAQIKGRVLAGDPSVTAAERARVETTIPYNLDAWDGYAYEREALLGAARTMQKNLVVLAGDTHNGWAGNLVTAANNPLAANSHAGVEFATSSVSSPGMEEYLSLDTSNPQAIAQTEQVIGLLIDHLHYTNLTDRGFLTLTFSRNYVDAQWHYVSSVKQRDYQMLENRRHTMRVWAGANRLDA